MKIKAYIHVLCLLAGLSLSAQDKVISRLQQDLPLKHDSTGYVDVLNLIGLRYHLSNTDSCFAYTVKARAIAERLHYKKGTADALNNLSIFYALKANMKQAIEYDYKAMLLYRELADSSNICQVLMNISVYHQYTGMEEEGEQSLYQAMDIGSRLPEGKDSIFSLILINYTLRFYNDTTRQDSVQWARNKAEVIARSYAESREVYYLQAFDALDLLHKGEKEKAFAQINELAEQAEEQGLTYVAVDLYVFITNFYKDQEAIPFLQKSLQLARQGGYLDLMQPAITSLYKYYLAHNDKTDAAIYGKMIWELQDRRTSMKNDRTVNYLDYFLREQELNEWQLSNKVQQEKITKANMKRSNRQWLVVSLIGLLLLLIGFTISRYRSYRNLRQQERMLADMNAAISEKNEQLRIHDDFKNKLISIIAHDFREPLNNIIQVSALFRDENADREMMQEIIDKAEHSSRKTLAVFDGILRWIRTQLSGFIYSPAPCNLHEQLNEIISHAGDNIPPDLVAAGDQEMLQFVHRNLLRNALTFGHHLQIGATKAADEIKVSITVMAVGFTATMAARLFEDNETDDAFTFIICKDFMVKMGGKIWAEVQGTQLTLAYTLPSFY